MPRPPAFVLWLATLCSGVALGLALGHRGPSLLAQSASVATTQATGVTKTGEEKDLYDDLAKSYERFQAIDRAFESVARVVSPAVVHITARKTGPREDAT